MIVTPQIFARLAAIVVLAVLLQLSFFSRVSMLGTSPDVLPSLVVVLGLLGGAVSGAVAGFAIGLLIDCLLVQTLGGTSLVLLATGYAAGLFRERFEIRSPLGVPLLCMGLTVAAEVGYTAVQAMIGIDSAVSPSIVRDILLKGIYAFFLSWPLYLVVRRLLRAALVEEGAPTRRRQPSVMGA